MVKITTILVFGILLFNRSVYGQLEGEIIFPWWNGDIYRANIDGSNPQLLAAETFAYQAVWSPDGSKIAYSGGQDELDFEIYVMNADGSQQLRLTDNDFHDTRPAWSPDSNKIAFTSFRDGNLEIYVMNADGRHQMNLSNNSARDIQPTWSPDGSKIAFASQRNGSDWELYTMDADGSNPVRLTNDEAQNTSPNWSPDGNMIAFLQTGADESCSQLYVMNTDGSNAIALTEAICELNTITWLPDNCQVLYQEYSNIYSVHVDDSRQERFATLPSNSAPVGPFDLYLSQDLTYAGAPTCS